MRKLSAVVLIMLAVRLAARDDNPGQIVAQWKPNIGSVEVRKIVVGDCELYVASGPISGAATSNPIPVSIATGKGCK